jgi:hypothetical protein
MALSLTIPFEKIPQNELAEFLLNLEPNPPDLDLL